MDQSPSDAVPGWSLPGYAVEQLLGFGAIGEVWRATERATGEPVALKRLRVGADAGARERLRWEGALLARISSPYIVRLRNVVGVPDGVVLVLDLAAGGSLAALLATRGRLDPGEVVTTAGPLAQALATAHEAGLLHGDVTPANILYAGDGRPMLADLGVARMMTGPEQPVDGTAEYLDPVVAAGGAVSAASDVHGLAAVCYHALTGRSPFEGATPGATLVAAAEGAHPPLRSLAPDTPPALTALVEAGLSPSPARRPTAAAFAVGMLAACPAAPVRLADGGPLVVEVPQTHPVTPIQPAVLAAVPAAEGSGRGRWLAAAIAALLLAGGIVAGVGMLLGSDDTAASAAADGTAGSTAAAPDSAAVGSGASGGDAPGPRAASPPADSLADDVPDFTAVVTELEQRRDDAFADREPTGLDGAYTDDAKARSADAAAIRALRERGAFAPGLSHHVVSVQVVSAEVDRAVLTVVDALPAYDLTDATGTGLLAHAARDEQAFEMVLRRGSDGWRIAEIAPSR